MFQSHTHLFSGNPTKSNKAQRSQVNEVVMPYLPRQKWATQEKFDVRDWYSPPPMCDLTPSCWKHFIYATYVWQLRSNISNHPTLTFYSDGNCYAVFVIKGLTILKLETAHHTVNFGVVKASTVNLTFNITHDIFGLYTKAGPHSLQICDLLHLHIVCFPRIEMEYYPFWASVTFFTRRSRILKS